MEKNVKEIVAEAERLDIKDKAVLALSELLFDKNMVSQISKFRVLFLRVSYVSSLCTLEKQTGPSALHPQPVTGSAPENLPLYPSLKDSYEILSEQSTEA